MNTYLLINICIIFFPLILSFENKIKFYKKFLPLMISVISVGTIFLIWEIIAFNRNDWSFNREFVSGITICNLPLEEVLFYITAPYSIIFIYECVKYYLKNRTYRINFFLIIFIVMVLLLTGIIFHVHYYTSTVFLFCGFLISTIGLSSGGCTFTKAIAVTVLISYTYLLIAEYILTSLPVVMYDHYSILGIRITSIPLENFVYLLSMILGWLFVYNRAERCARKKKHLLSNL